MGVNEGGGLGIWIGFWAIGGDGNYFYDFAGVFFFILPLIILPLSSMHFSVTILKLSWLSLLLFLALPKLSIFLCRVGDSVLNTYWKSSYQQILSF